MFGALDFCAFVELDGSPTEVGFGLNHARVLRDAGLAYNSHGMTMAFTQLDGSPTEVGFGDFEADVWLNHARVLRDAG